VVLRLNSDFTPSGSVVIRELTGIDPHPYRSGDHTAEGICMLSGRGIVPGHHAPGFDLVDAPATILPLMGATTPDFFAGRCMTPAFSVDYLRSMGIGRRAVDTAAETLSRKAGGVTPADDDQEALKQRLEGLGYL
ncbi:hypothetical protein JW905_05085, partial [bacterium]|nr:hypothetical protein [candidate division CSSED10-310 bacterium]